MLCSFSSSVTLYSYGLVGIALAALACDLLALDGGGVGKSVIPGMWGVASWGIISLVSKTGISIVGFQSVICL